MADCHDLFQIFYEKVAITSARKDQLRTSRDAIRERIRKHFIETMDESPPTFHGQGSFSMNTLINPIEGNYDIDDGVYLQHLTQDRNTWPTAATVHNWLIAAVADSTDAPPQGRARCVRVSYKATPPYHIDLATYVMSNDIPLIFDTNREKAPQPPVSPYESDPRAMTDWFIDKVDEGEQLRRLVRYTKAWKDFKKDQGAGIAKGLTLTILVAETIVTDDRDDLALSKTLDAAYSRLSQDISIRKPVSLREDLADTWTANQKVKFLDRLKQFRDRAHDAIDETDKAEASIIWRQLFGDRFPEFTLPEKTKSATPLRTPAPAILGNDGRSA